MSQGKGMDLCLLRELFDEELTHWWHLGKRELVLSFLAKNKNRVLVLGVGGGWLCHHLMQKGFTVQGVDVSKEVYQHALLSYGFEILPYDLENGLPFEENKFDAIIITDVLEHVHKEKDLVMHMHRCLAKGGHLILTVPAYTHMWSHWDELLGHCRRYEKRHLHGLIEDAGFKIKKISYFNVLIYPAAFIWRKWLDSNENRGRDFKVISKFTFINTLMGNYYSLERFWLRWSVFPFGLSLLVYAEK